MPIMVDYTPGNVAASLALAAGNAQGRAERVGQQRELDARLTSQVLGQRHDLKRIALADASDARRMDQQERAQRDNMQVALERLSLDRRDADRMDYESRAKVQKLESDTALEGRERQIQLEALDKQYEGRQKDATYYAARGDLVAQGRYSDRSAGALGVGESPDRLAREKAQADGTLDQYEPKTEGDRRARRMLEIGSFDQVGKQLSRLGDKGFGPDDRTFNDVMDARIQLEGWARTTDDPSALLAAATQMREQGVPDEALAPIENRLAEIRKQEMQVKAPMAMETAQAAFARQSMLLAKELGRALTPVESSRVLGESIKRTAASMGLDLAALEDYVLSEEDLSTAATRAAKETMTRLQAANPSGAEPSGSEERYGPDEAPGQSLEQTMPGVEINGTNLTLPPYLVPVSPEDPGTGVMIDMRTGRKVNGEDIIRRAIAERWKEL